MYIWLPLFWSTWSLALGVDYGESYCEVFGQNSYLFQMSKSSQFFLGHNFQSCCGQTHVPLWPAETWKAGIMPASNNLNCQLKLSKKHKAYAIQKQFQASGTF